MKPRSFAYRIQSGDASGGASGLGRGNKINKYEKMFKNKQTGGTTMQNNMIVESSRISLDKLNFKDLNRKPGE